MPQRSTHPCSPTWSQPRDITSNGMPTTRSKPITASSSTDSGRCADCALYRPDRDHRTRLRSNLRRGHFEVAVGAPSRLRVAAAFTELAQAICSSSSTPPPSSNCPPANDPKHACGRRQPSNTGRPPANGRARPWSGPPNRPDSSSTTPKTTTSRPTRCTPSCSTADYAAVKPSAYETSTSTPAPPSSASRSPPSATNRSPRRSNPKPVATTGSSSLGGSSLRSSPAAAVVVQITLVLSPLAFLHPCLR
jgi:hypothetical protein